MGTLATRAACHGAHLALALLLLLSLSGPWLSAVVPGTPPLFNVSLDVAPEQRWLPMLRHYDPDFLRTAVAQVIGDRVPQWVLGMVGEIVSKVESFLPQPFTDEIRSICDSLNLSLADGILVNLAYEASAFCTSIVAQDSQGRIYHGRNLDYPFGKILRKLTADVQFIKNGQIAFTGTTFVGYVGLWTGQSPHKFTISGDERDKGWWWENMIAALSLGHSPISWLIRKTLSESESFEAAVYTLAKTPLIADVYYIVGGTSPKEGVVITRDRGGPADIWPLDPLNGEWFRVETNYDHWKPAPKVDDRRTPAIKALNATGQAHLNLETLFQLHNLYYSDERCRARQVPDHDQKPELKVMYCQKAAFRSLRLEGLSRFLSNAGSLPTERFCLWRKRSAACCLGPPDFLVPLSFTNSPPWLEQLI